MIGTNEWDFDKQSGSCQYNDAAPHQVQSGCCGTSCAIAGAGTTCKRLNFSGDGLICCLRDFANIGTPQLCFESDANMDNTCNPNYRALDGNLGALQIGGGNLGPNCRDFIFDHCVQPDINNWNGPDSDCVRALDRNLFGQNIGGLSVSLGIPVADPSAYTSQTGGFAWSKSVMDQLIENIYQNGQVLGVPPGSTNVSDLEPIVRNICLTSPGLCETALTNRVCAGETSSSVTLNPFKLPFCGCYLGDEFYAKYVNTFQVTKECTPLCARNGNIGLVEADGITQNLCNQDVCIIDDVNIQITNMQGQIGNVTFSQTCGGCNNDQSTATCQCVIQGENIIATDGLINDINIVQDCGAQNFTCTQIIDDVETLVDCNTGEPIMLPPPAPIDVPSTTNPDFFKQNETLFIAAGTIVVIILFVFIIIELSRNHKTASDTNKT
uniref:Transmembrane protein n=1 Tax=Pithovirus LCPAC404 TaxID=2506597 RepID=A0A481ZCM4_9VIRU|nr:MAG: transmembrane protein [Pithovirus LCPAC404]